MLALNRGTNLLSCFAEQCKIHSANRAVASKGISWSYAQLDAISAACASNLLNGSPQRAPVALLMTHAAPLIAAIFGVLRSGGFYIVLNPAHSILRLAQVCEDVQPRAIITDAEHAHIAGHLLKSSRQVLFFDELAATNSALLAKSEPSPNEPFALFYTSGSLKVPKPLVYTWGGTFRNAVNYARLLNVQSCDRSTLLSPCSAAASVSSLFASLLNGASIHPFQPGQEGLNAMANWIERERITIYHSVPSVFRRFLRTLDPDHVLSSVRAVRLGGEPVFASDVELFRRHFRGDAMLINGFGMTEANGAVSYCQITDHIGGEGMIVPVGRPAEGVEIKLLNDDDSEAGPCEAGEILLRGDHIAPAFWTGNDVKRFGLGTDEWFRTGDLGRKNDADLLEHLGRKDNQLKRRGQWVSLVEVETALLQFEGVLEAVAVAVEQKNAENAVAAFLCWKDTPLSEQELRRRLMEKLPAHALPSFFISVADLPLLPNGKIDRRALSQIAKDSVPQDAEVQSQTFDSIMLEILSLWKEVLEIENITVKDDFFSLGGDSLAAAEIMAAVEKIFRVRLPTVTLLRAPTIEKLAKKIRNSNGARKRLQAVACQLRGNNPPLYYVPAAGSEAFELGLLPRYLSAEQPILAFQPKGFDGRARYQASVEEMAKSYLVHLRLHQPRGPYYLCGNCFGGVVAFEMAKRLTAMGEQVAFLGLFDSYAGDYPKPRVTAAAAARKPVGPLLSKLCQWIAEAIKDRKSLKEKLFEIDVALQFSLFARDYESRSACLRRLCRVARRRYRLQPYPGRIDLFRTDDLAPPEFYEPDPLLGWSGMALKGIEVHELSGRHGDYMREPHIREFAKLLNDCLARAQLSAHRSLLPQSLSNLTSRYFQSHA